MAKKKDKERQSTLSTLSAEERELLMRFREGAADAEHSGSDRKQEFLSMLRSSLPLSMAAVEELASQPSPEAARLAVEIGRFFPDKGLHKMVKKTLFRLKQKHVPVEGLLEEENGQPIFRLAERPEPFGMVSAIDAMGDRMAFLAFPLQPTGWILVGGVAGDDLGLRNMVFNRMTRSELDDFLEKFDPDSAFALLRTSAEHVCSLFMESAAGMRKKGDEPPSEFLELKPWISENCEPLQRPMVYTVLNESDVSERPELMARSRSLLEMPPFNGWILPYEKVIPYLEKMEEASHTRLVLAPTQKASLLDDVRRKAATELFPPERRMLLRRRLEESAYLLHLKGMDTEAETALAAALNVDTEPGVLQENEFLPALVGLSLAYWEERTQRKEEKKTDSGLIIT